METTVRSIIGGHLQTQMLLNKPIEILQNSTLNEKFNVAANETLNEGEVPSVKYITIGNGGHYMAVTANNIQYPKSHVHKPTDFALFNHIPFVCREIDNDLSSTERLKYRLRVLDYINGKPYAVYYAKVLDLNEAKPIVNIVSIKDGVTSLKPFEPTLSNLSPTPTVLKTEGVNTTTGDYLASNSIASLVMNTNDITELLNACEIMYGDSHVGIISEIGLCTGFDRQVNGDFNGVQQKYTEVIACQIYSTSACFHDMSSTGSKLEITINIGAVEQLLV